MLPPVAAALSQWLALCDSLTDMESGAPGLDPSAGAGELDLNSCDNVKKISK